MSSKPISTKKIAEAAVRSKKRSKKSLVQLITNDILNNLTTKFILITSFIARLVFLIYGLYQDKYMKLPYTDIDYFVFTDAAKYVFNGQSPFLRETYRYTPLLSWILLPINYWFEFGKIIFVLCDLITGYLILKILESLNLPGKNVTNLKKLSLIWFWNPMVITISTRGSSESLLTVIVLLICYMTLRQEYILNGILMGLAIHLKIYPFIYIPTILLLIDNKNSIFNPITPNRLKFLISTIITFWILTYLMYTIYGDEFLNESIFYHLERLDHRHNFSIFNISLYFSSFTGKSSIEFLNNFNLKIEKLAFIPQLLLSCILLPLKLVLQKRYSILNTKKNNLLNFNFISIFFIQTFTFVTFNKVITSQYFIWYLCLLPIYLATTKINSFKGLVLISGWIITQGLWLYNGYKLEFLGDLEIFKIGIWSSSVIFFIWEVYMIGEFIADVRLQDELLTIETSDKKDN
ncbi:hypothetical protein B5S32_g823 [[Candida] boidinii]|nr:hypothetical protein B5S32_g823 [[Candida] boidinii]